LSDSEPYSASVQCLAANGRQGWGFELERTLDTLSAPWHRGMLPVANGEAVCVFRRRLGVGVDRRGASRP
jgi:hypothetical protein